MANKWAKQIENAKVILARIEEHKEFVERYALPVDGDDPADDIAHLEKTIEYYKDFIERRSQESN